jgi:hypothetical protein
MTGRTIDTDISVVLSRVVRIIDPNAYTYFVYTIDSVIAPGTKLYFIIDGLTVGAFAAQTSF